MKTFCVVALYTVMVAALDLGGAVWTSLRAAHCPAKEPVSAAKTVAAPVKTGSAIRPAGTIPSNT